MSHRLFKDEGWHEVVWTTAIVALFLFVLGFPVYTDPVSLFIEIGKNIGQGLLIGLLIFS
jgi:hypothetical protein